MSGINLRGQPWRRPRPALRHEQRTDNQLPRPKRRRQPRVAPVRGIALVLGKRGRAPALPTGARVKRRQVGAAARGRCVARRRLCGRRRGGLARQRGRRVKLARARQRRRLRHQQHRRRPPALVPPGRAVCVSGRCPHDKRRHMPGSVEGPPHARARLRSCAWQGTPLAPPARRQNRRGAHRSARSTHATAAGGSASASRASAIRTAAQSASPTRSPACTGAQASAGAGASSAAAAGPASAAASRSCAPAARGPAQQCTGQEPQRPPAAPALQRLQAGAAAVDRRRRGRGAARLREHAGQRGLPQVPRAGRARQLPLLGVLPACGRSGNKV